MWIVPSPLKIAVEWYSLSMSPCVSVSRCGRASNMRRASSTAASEFASSSPWIGHAPKLSIRFIVRSQFGLVGAAAAAAAAGLSPRGERNLEPAPFQLGRLCCGRPSSSSCTRLYRSASSSRSSASISASRTGSSSSFRLRVTLLPLDASAGTSSHTGYPYKEHSPSRSSHASPFRWTRSAVASCERQRSRCWPAPLRRSATVARWSSFTRTTTSTPFLLWTLLPSSASTVEWLHLVF